MSDDLLTLEEILQEASRLELDLSERTFRYYGVMGLLPKPIRRPGSGDARVHYYAREVILKRLSDIRQLQSQGYSLKQIKKIFEAPAALHPRTGAIVARADAGSEELAVVHLLVQALDDPQGWPEDQRPALLEALLQLIAKATSAASGKAPNRHSQWTVQLLEQLHSLASRVAAAPSASEAEELRALLLRCQRELLDLETLLTNYRSLLSQQAPVE